MPEKTEVRPIKYVNTLIEQDPRLVNRRINPSLGFGTFNTARRTIRGYEAMNMIRKGQINNVNKGDAMGQISFINEIFGITA